MWFYYRLLVAPTVQSDSLHWPFFSIFSIQFQHVINWSLHPVSSEISILRSDYYTYFCACSVMFYFRLTLSYMFSIFPVLTHTCPNIFLWCRFRFPASKSRMDRFPISSSADSVVSPHSPRRTVMSFISVFSHLVSIFYRFSSGLSQYF